VINAKDFGTYLDVTLANLLKILYLPEEAQEDWLEGEGDDNVTYGRGRGWYGRFGGGCFSADGIKRGDQREEKGTQRICPKS